MDRFPFRSVGTQRCAPPPDIASKLRDIEPPEGCGIDKEEWALFIGLISRTGLRRGECASLEIGNLSLYDEIPWFISRNEKQGMGQTNRKERAIPVPASCLEMLRRLASAHKSERYLFSTVGRISGTSELGMPFEVFGVKIGKTWNKIAQKVWPRMDLHTWRHYCSIHVNRRFPQEVAMRLLGHSPGFREINEIYNERNLQQLRDAVNSIP